MKINRISAFALFALVLVATTSHTLAQTASVPPGDGDVNDPWLISTVEHLLWISDETAGGNDFADEYFVQTQDIDAGVTSTWFPDGGGGFQGFPPIGPSSSEPFAGHYNGAGHVISNLYINRPGSNRVSLFGELSAAGSITNLGVVNAAYTGEIFIGGLVGLSRGLIERSFSTGTITSDGTSGGLVGANAPGAILRDVYSLVDITSEYRSGGLVGDNLGLIENAFAAGNIEDTLGNWPNSFGGLVGENDAAGSTVIAGFWNIDTSGYPGADDGAGDQTEAQSGIVGISTTGLQDIATFDGLWAVEGRINLPTGYPVLQWQIDQDFSADAPVWLMGIDPPPPQSVPFASSVTLWIMALLLGLLTWRVLAVSRHGNT